MKEAARWLIRHPDHVIGPGSWLYEFRSTIESYRDPPKSLEELRRGVSIPRRGYDVHHIVEQTSAEQDGFSRREIDAPGNLVSIPRMKHWAINGWYGRPSKDYGGRSPREYLRGKDWDERVRIGRQALMEHGVLKP